MDNQQESIEDLVSEIDDPGFREELNEIRQQISVGDISNSEGVAIGRNIRLVINKYDCPPDLVSRLLELRYSLVNIDVDRYKTLSIFSDKIRDFVGRNHVFEKINTFLDKYSNGYFIVVGEPGIGKSAVMAEFLRRSGCIAHFNVKTLGIVSATQFIENVGQQLIQDYGLTNKTIPLDAARDGTFILKLLEQVSEKLAPTEKVIIAIDALDEVDINLQTSGSNILYLPDALPRGIYVVASRRPKKVPLVTRSPYEEFDLENYHAENFQDVELFLRYAITRADVSHWITKHGMANDEFVHELAVRSQNNFMYLSYVLPELEKGAYQSLSIQSLPMGLIGYYEDHWNRMKGVSEAAWFEYKLKIIVALTIIQEPVSLEHLATFSQVSQKSRIRNVLGEWSQFLHEEDYILSNGETQKRYRIYHTSFHDFIYKKEEVDDERIDLKKAHGVIADQLWNTLGLE